MDTPIISSDQFPIEYTAQVFTGGEVPTSAKLNTITAEAATQFDIMAIGLGNTFIHGIANLGAAIAGGPSNSSTAGEFANLTNYINPALNVASIPAIFAATSYTNQMSCVIAPAGPTGPPWSVQVSGALLASHHVVTGSSPTQVYNILIARRPGNTGPITDIFYPTNCTTSQVGDVTVFTTDVPGLYASASDFIVLASNVSLIDALLQAIQNIGVPTFANTSGRINPTNDTILDTEPVGAPVSNEINNIENKLFTLRWHARVQKGIGSTLNGANTQWTISASSAGFPFQAGSTPSPQMVSNYLANMGAVSNGGATLESFACVNGAPIMTALGAVPVVVTPASSALTVGLPTTSLLNIGNTQNIDIYFPIQIPYRLLQSVNMNYDLESAMIPDWFANVVGLQYAWTQSPYPNTIANRLDLDESNISTVTSYAYSIGNGTIPNGGFEFWVNATPVPVPNQWNMGTTGTATFVQDTTNPIEGSSALQINIGANIGSSVTALTQTPIRISPLSTYYIKFKTFASSANMSGSVTVSFFAGDGTGIGVPQTLWAPTPGAYPTAWTTCYGVLINNNSTGILLPYGVSAVVVPAGARSMSITLTGGGGTSPAGSYVEFDAVSFFAPTHYNETRVYTGGQTTTFQVPSNCTNIVVDMVAGGGGGGCGGGSNPGCTGGGSGAYNKIAIAVIPESICSLSVGLGGAPAPSNGNGSPGGNTTFTCGGFTYTVTGGGAGTDHNSGNSGGTGYQLLGLASPPTSSSIILSYIAGTGGATYYGGASGFAYGGYYNNLNAVVAVPFSLYLTSSISNGGISYAIHNGYQTPGAGGSGMLVITY